MFVPNDHDVSSPDGVGEEHCRGRFRCLPCFVCQSEEWACAVELCALHVGSEDHWVLPLGDDISDSLVDGGFLCISACDPPCLVGERELHTSWIKDGISLPETADAVIATPDVCNAVQEVVNGGV